MERKIGEIFEYNGEWYQCVQSNSCSGCSLLTTECGSSTKDEVFGECVKARRADNKYVIFKKCEKVGEPHFIEDEIFESGKVYVQNFKVYKDFEGHKPICNDYIIYDWKNRIISIEIKQNKEDMKEKKQCGDNRFRAIARAKEHLFQATNIAEDKKELEVLDSFLMRCWQMGWLKQYEDVEEKKSNLSPFDIQKAREGKPVCTRDGRKARIICFDRKDNTPIVALIECVNHAEILQCVHNDGKCFHYDTSNNDLMMPTEKKEGWVNVYKGIDGVTFSKYPYTSKDEAIKESDILFGRIDTIKVSWEE